MTMGTHAGRPDRTCPLSRSACVSTDMDLDRLITTHRRPIERHLRRRVGDPSLAEDLAQEVFLRAWLHAPADLPELRLRAWLYRVATNVAIDALRARAGRVGGVPVDGALLDALDRAAATETEDPDERLAIEAALAQCRRASARS